ncbi:MAG TPA: TerC family protein [Thermoanaerobaculia bacterium]|nr:TerC family protein [Thermoanaerobaculia bacterium]
MTVPISMWVGFSLFVLLMLALDLGVFHRKAHAVRMKEALAWSAVWIGLAFVFNALVYFWYGEQKALEFLAGYLIEKTLSVDNVFVFVVLFGAFAVPREYQHRVLFWGVLGALVMRAVCIAAGAALLQHFHWVIYIFGALLVVTAVKLLRQKNETIDPSRNPLYRMFAKRIPSVPEYDGEKFFTIRNGKRYATPLLLVLLAIEATDLVFAVDSIPAIFAITNDPFIVYTSNVFAILGLRALYFVLADVVDKFVYIKPALAVILGFVGVKMLLMEVYKIPIAVSLGVIASTLVIAAVASVLHQRKAGLTTP